jgi:hypothetical protein
MIIKYKVKNNINIFSIDYDVCEYPSLEDNRYRKFVTPRTILHACETDYEKKSGGASFAHHYADDDNDIYRESGVKVIATKDLIKALFALKHMSMFNTEKEIKEMF